MKASETPHPTKVPLDRRERDALCGLLLDLGPEAPTLCEGWTTAHLAAHLALRERFRPWNDERIAAHLTRDYTELVAQVRRPPLLPWQVPWLRGLLNDVELVIHHEDVRRANGLGPRTGVEDVQQVAWRATTLFGRRLLRRLRPYGLLLRRPDGTTRSFGDAPYVELDGEPLELLLYLSGRTGAAEVTVGGDDAALAALADTDQAD